MPGTESILAEIKTRFLAILGENLTGIYVHGSIAFGCFRWQHSDIDFIAVVEQPVEREEKLRLLQALVSLLPQGPAAGIEMSVVLRQYSRYFVYPTPYELHFSKDWLERYRTDPRLLTGDEPKTDRDLAAHFTVIREVGQALLGPPANEVFGPVPWADYLDSIHRDATGACREIRDDPVYGVLNLCRVRAAVEQGLVLSKEQGGRWALEHIEEMFRPLVRRALEAYAGNGEMELGKGEGEEFCTEMLGPLRRVGRG